MPDRIFIHTKLTREEVEQAFPNAYAYIKVTTGWVVCMTKRGYRAPLTRTTTKKNQD